MISVVGSSSINSLSSGALDQVEAPPVVSVNVSGTAVVALNEGKLVTGGETVILDLVNATWVPDDGTFA